MKVRKEKSCWGTLVNYTKGKACIYVNKLADIDTNVLKDLIIYTVETYQNLYPNE